MYSTMDPRKTDRERQASSHKPEAPDNRASGSSPPSLLAYLGTSEETAPPASTGAPAQPAPPHHTAAETRAEIPRSAQAYAPQQTQPLERPRSILQSVPWHEISLDAIVEWLWRGRWIVLVLAVLGALAGIAFARFAEQRYTVGSQIIIDPTDLRVVADDLFAQSSQLDTQIYDVESKLRVLTSANVLNNVIDSLQLEKDPEFGDDTGDTQSLRLEALRSLEQHVTARREENSFVVNLDVWSTSAPKALDIANSIITNFQEELVRTQAEGAGRVAAELTARLDTLKQEVATADEAAQRFRREHNILSSSGELVSSIVANQTNTQLVDAQARVIRARSRFQELSTGSPESRLDSASIESQTMTALRTQYAAARREMDAQLAVFGARHPRIAAMQPQLEAIQNQIAAEQARILSAARSELGQAEAALMAQQDQANTMKSVVFEDNDALVQLRQLEREAESRATVYQAFMARTREIAERQQINTTNVRIISPPVLPKGRSYPPRTLYLTAGGMIGGFALGCALVCAIGFMSMMNAYRARWREA